MLYVSSMRHCRITGYTMSLFNRIVYLEYISVSRHKREYRSIVTMFTCSFESYLFWTSSMAPIVTTIMKEKVTHIHTNAHKLGDKHSYHTSTHARTPRYRQPRVHCINLQDFKILYSACLYANTSSTS